MITLSKETEYVRDDTKNLVDFATMGIYPCKYCEKECSKTCRAWPIWFSVRWQRIQKKFKR